MTDWSLIEDSEIAPLIENMVRKLVRQAGGYGVFEYDDALQEARILVATNPTVALEKLERGPGLFSDWLYGLLFNVFETNLARASRCVSSDALLDSEEDG